MPLFPIIGTLLCLLLFASVEDPASTYLRFFIWMGIGLIIYFAYGRRHSLLQRGRRRPGG